MSRSILILMLCFGVIAILLPFVLNSNNHIGREEVKNFMLKDRTDRNEYIANSYVCKDFVSDVIRNAGKEGLKAYSVGVHLVSKTNETHAIALFRTDDGDIYVDATQADNWVVIDFDTMKYDVYSMDNNKLVLSTYIDWYLEVD